MVALTLPHAQVQSPVELGLTHQLFGPFGITAMVLVAMVMITWILFQDSESRHRAGILDAIFGGFAELVRALAELVRALPAAIRAAIEAIREFFGKDPSDGTR
ncbi:hypothetical protein [Pseudonocardia adelaidensis]|uniref:Uncharacterized protein n=1 Tax=Pseudonocardia adelaidensis TaxID=648754 RepID=A0ABP9P3N8_9PSEU